MPGITWLHLSDWHQKVSPDAARNPVRERLLADIRDRGRNISPELEQIDFIVFTGDIAYQARPNEYGATMQQFIRPVIGAAGVDYNHEDNKTIFLVPGNHDLDRSKIAAVAERYPVNFQDSNAISQLNDYLSDPVKRADILEPFSAYSDFVFTHFRGDERDQDKQAAYCYVKLLELAGKTVAIVGLNSAIFSARNIVTSANGQQLAHDYGYLALTEAQIDDAFREVSDADIKIALLHHPLSWLVEEDRVAVQDALSKHCHFILHGHEHMRRVEVTNSTLGNHVVIPAGSSYDRRHPSNPRYTNAYNFVHLNLDTNQATVYLRSWHEQGRTWGDDTESAPNGRVVFPIQDLLNLSPCDRDGRYQESLRSSPFSVEYQAHHLRINRFGDAQLLEEYSGIRVKEASLLLEQSIRIENRTTAGKFSTNIESVSKTDGMADPRWIPSSDNTAQHVKGELRFHRPLGFNRGPVNFTISSQVFNAFALNASQRKRMYDEEKPECYGRSVFHPVETLFLIVSFPSSIQTPAFDVVVEDQDGNRNALEENWCRPYLRVSELNRTVSLNVSKPLISHSYQITWELAKVEPSQDTNVEREQEAGLIVQKLLQLDTRPESSQEHPLHEIFEDLRKDLLASYPSKAESNEQFDIGLLVYDESKNIIRPVAGILRPEYWRWRLYDGQGASGRAHKLNEAVLYVHSRVDPSTDWYIGPPEPVVQPQVVLSVPIRYPIVGKDGWIIGVLTVASASLASGLLCLYERKENVLVLIEHFHKGYFQRRILPALGLSRLSEA